MPSAPIFSKTTSDFPWPAPWNWLVDQAAPALVKERYSPKESWKKKPFAKEDAFFFAKGVTELSELLTEDRPDGPPSGRRQPGKSSKSSEKLPRYMDHPRFRSSYLLYYLPLQAAKFVALFMEHQKALESMVLETLKVQDPKEVPTLRIMDLGAGPGTASLSLLLGLDVLFKTSKKVQAALEACPMLKIEMQWWDQQKDTLADGKILAERLFDHLAWDQMGIRCSLEVKLHFKFWHHALNAITPSQKPSLVLMGNVLNENTEQEERVTDTLLRIFAATTTGGLLIVEPGFRAPSQYLAYLRSRILDQITAPLALGSPIWGPCLHSQACPLISGRDWCHVSSPIRTPGQWFKFFSKGLGSERQWLKYGYLWMAALQNPAPTPSPDIRRVVSDVIKDVNAKRKTADGEIMLCEPEVVRRIPIHQGRTTLYRGALYAITAKGVMPNRVGAIVKPKTDPTGPLAGASGFKGRNLKAGPKGRK